MYFSVSDEHIHIYRRSSWLNERRYTLQEECSELIKELSKANRYISDIEKIKEEMAHTLISLYSVAKDMDITQSDIDKYVRLKEEKENG